MPSQTKLSIWKKLYFESIDLDISDEHIDRIKKASNHQATFSKSFEALLKNKGVSFLILDPTETQIQLLHHGHVLSGNWSNPTKKLIAILGTDSETKPVEISQKSIKNVKDKTFGFNNLLRSIDEKKDFTNMANADMDYLYKNILPISSSLTKAFIKLDSSSPYEVAKAFMLLRPDRNKKSTEKPTPANEDLNSSTDSKDNESQESRSIMMIGNPTEANETTEILQEDDILYAIQFCQLCANRWIPPVTYSVYPDKEISLWFQTLVKSLGIKKSSTGKHQGPLSPTDDNSDLSSPENKISKKDHVFINTMMKLHDMMDKSSKSKEDKEPGFKYLEAHCKKMILNALAVPPFTTAAESPTEFYATFLAKKCQFKAKDMLLHRFQSDKIAFNPNQTFITKLWNSKFFWLLPDTPSGISVFYCPEMKSNNSAALECERNLALADKVNASDIDKLAKQKISLPTSLMDLVWTVQNFHTVILLCFRKSSHSASFLQDLINCIYDNRILYTSSQTSDPYFFARIMYTMDNALERHWHSCSSAPNRSSVNDSVLRMDDIQDAILGLSFNQMLPKTISDKVLALITPSKDGNGLRQGKNGKHFLGFNQDKQDNKDLIYDNDRSHQGWRLKENENFAKIFYKNQKECPKTAEGKTICLKFFLCGVCTKDCSRAHSLSTDDKKKFEIFIKDCCEKAPRQDF